MKGIAESLSTIGQLITNEDLLQYVLDGLGLVFDAAVVNLTYRIESKFDLETLQEPQFLFQKYELRLEKFNSTDFQGGSINVTAASNIGHRFSEPTNHSTLTTLFFPNSINNNPYPLNIVTNP